MFQAASASMTVSEITQHIKTVFECDSRLQDVWIEGEISNWSRSRTGHCYLTLKDAKASIRAVIWRSLADRLTFRPQDGQAVLAHGHISVYEPQGQYQLYIDRLQPRGQGALYLEFEALKSRLEAEGLFDQERKRPVPILPTCIGIVTSPTAAALRDVLNILQRRWPLVQVKLSPTLVQGKTAPPQIIAALEALYDDDEVSVIIVTRGGGSMEDLWAFNDELVARTILRSPVPVISGVGHQVDFTIADFVADLRAPTPSAAAEVAVPDQVEILGHLTGLRAALEQAAEQILSKQEQAFTTVHRQLEYLSPAVRIMQERQRIDTLALRMDQATRHNLDLNKARLGSLNKQISGLNPYATLKRGYAIAHDHKGRIIRQVKQAENGQAITVRVSDGIFGARVEE